MQGLCDDDVTVQQFCTKYVEPMGEESDHLQLVALTDALLVSPVIAAHITAVQAVLNWLAYESREGL